MKPVNMPCGCQKTMTRITFQIPPPVPADAQSHLMREILQQHPWYGELETPLNFTIHAVIGGEATKGATGTGQNICAESP